MRKNQRRMYEDEGNYKTILLMSGGILLIAIITFFIIYGIYNKKLEEVELGSVNENSIKLELDSKEKISNSTIVSSSIGKNIEEVKKDEKEVFLEVNLPQNKVMDNKEEIKNDENNNEQQMNEVQKIEKSSEVVEEIEPDFESPIEDGKILREFAVENLVYSETLKEWVTHPAIDIKAPKTTVVKAAEKGIVESIKNDPRYGITIILKHDKNYKTVYSNLLTTEFVNVGDEVEKGQSLGTVGNTAAFEISDEPHLHFEIIKDGEKINPALYID